MARSRRRWLFALGAAALVLVLGGLGSVAVWRAKFAQVSADGRLEAWANRRPERLRVEWREVESRWPGQLAVRGLRVAGRTQRQLWEIRVERVTARISPLPLLARELRFTGIRGEGATIRVARFEVPETGGLLARLPAGEKPEIAGFPAEPAPPPPPTRRPWTFGFRDIQIGRVSEIRVDDRAASGSLALRGGFETRRRKTARVFDSRVTFSGLDLLAGTTSLARNLTGELRFETEPYPYRGARFEQVVRVLHGHLALRGEVEAAAIVDALLAPWPWLSLEGGALQADARLVVDRGALAAGSRLELEQPAQRLELLGFEARGDARLSASIVRGAAGDELDSRLRLGDWQLGRPGEEAVMFGRGLILHTRSEAPRWGEPPGGLRVELDLGEARLPDLRFVNAYLPPAAETAIEAGEAVASGTFRFTGAGESGEGGLDVRAEKLRLVARGQRLAGKLEADLRLAEPNLDARTFSLLGTRLALREVAGETTAGDSVAGWWGEVTMTSGRVQLGQPIDLSGDFHARLADSSPLIAYYEIERDLPRWVERLLLVRGLSATGRVEWAPGRFELVRSELPLPHGELRARLCIEDDLRQGRLLARWRRLAVGVELDGDQRRLKLRDAAAWYDSDLEPGGSDRGAAAKPPRPR